MEIFDQEPVSSIEDVNHEILSPHGKEKKEQQPDLSESELEDWVKEERKNNMKGQISDKWRTNDVHYYK